MGWMECGRKKWGGPWKTHTHTHTHTSSRNRKALVGQVWMDGWTSVHLNIDREIDS